MKQYLALMNDVLTNGRVRADRTGTGTIAVFGRTIEFNLADGFPLVTTKKINWKKPLLEMLWMINGHRNVKWLNDNGVHFWDPWADADGDLGPIYGNQWRKWRKYDVYATEHYINHGSIYEYDQLVDVLHELLQNKYSRRHLVSAWNVADLNEMKLPPCHYAFQFYVDVREDGTEYLDCMVQMRSVDVFLGLPYDIAGYAFLMHIFCYKTGYLPGRLIFNLGDTHIYSNHIEQCHMQVERTPFDLPFLTVSTPAYVFPAFEDFELRHFDIKGYTSHPAIKGDISV